LSAKDPTLTIGLPVYNGEDYLAEALDSILAQTFGDFRLIITDNASTDRTEEICRSYAANDRRIEYHRNRRNLGVASNFNLAFELSSSRYFKWAAHDDRLHPEFLQRCIDFLESDPSCVLCHCRCAKIDPEGEVVGDYGLIEGVDSPEIHVRFGALLDLQHVVWDLFGVFRAETLARTPLLASYVGSDRNLLAEIGLLGRIKELDETLFYRREHPRTSTGSHVDYHTRLEQYCPEHPGEIPMPYWRRLHEYIGSVERIQMGRMQRLLCLLEVMKWVKDEGWRVMGSDVERAFLAGCEPGRRFASSVKWLIRRTVKPVLYRGNSQ
jgi:glycosyltransferase involved in cell wall biosynthesis